eukprot:scaffold52764_cov39-Phaeocystis_antarctica.AAC.1
MAPLVGTNELGTRAYGRAAWPLVQSTVAVSDSRRARIHWCARVPSLLLTCSFPPARRWPAGAGRRLLRASPAPARRFESAQDARRLL